MALTIYENKEAGGRMVKVDRRLCLDAAGQICEAGTKESVSLYAGEGKEVSRADFEARGGVVEDEPTVAAAEPKPKATPKPKPKRKTKKRGK